MFKIVSLAIIVDEKNYICMLRDKKKTGVNHDPVLAIRVSSEVFFLCRQRLNVNTYKKAQWKRVLNMNTSLPIALLIFS